MGRPRPHNQRQIYEPIDSRVSEFRLDAYMLARPTIGQINPHYQQRLAMQHGRFLAGLGSANPTAQAYDPEYKIDTLQQLEQEDDVYGSGIFDSYGRKGTVNVDMGVFADNPNLPGYVGREILFAVSQEVSDITNNADVVVVPGGGMSYVDRGMMPQPYDRFGPKPPFVDIQGGAVTGRAQPFTMMTPGPGPSDSQGPIRFAQPMSLPPRRAVNRPMPTRWIPPSPVPGPTFTQHGSASRTPYGMRPAPEHPSSLTPVRGRLWPSRYGPTKVSQGPTSMPRRSQRQLYPGFTPSIPGSGPLTVEDDKGERTFGGKAVATAVPVPSLTGRGVVQQSTERSMVPVRASMPYPSNVTMPPQTMPHRSRGVSGFGDYPAYDPSVVPQAPGELRIGKASIVNAGVVSESVTNPQSLPLVPFNVQQNILPYQDISRIGIPRAGVPRRQAVRKLSQTQGLGAADEPAGFGTYLFAGAIVGVAAGLVANLTKKSKKRR